MAVIAHAFVEMNILKGTNSAVLVDVPDMSLPSSSFTAGKQYLLLISWTSNTGVANDPGTFSVRHGSTAFPSDDAEVTIVYQGTNRGSHQWWHVWTAVSGEDITLQWASAATSLQNLNFGSMLAINLSDDLAASDWAFAEVATNSTITATPVSGASITLTPGAASDWLVLSMAHIDRGDGTTQSATRLERSGAVSSTGPFATLEQTANYTGNFVLASIVALTAATHTFTEQCYTNTGVAHSRLHSKIFALNLAKFKNAAWVYTAGSVALGTTDYGTLCQTLALTPTVASDLWVGAFFTFDRNNAAREVEWRVQINNVDVPAGQTTANYQFNEGTAAVDEAAILHSTLVPSASGALTIDLDGSTDAVTGAPAATQRLLWAITMELAAAGPTGYTLNADPGSYAVTGAAATLRAARKLVATPGAYAVTGASAALTVTTGPAGWVAVETFDSYTVSANLNGLNGGSGWGTAWTDFGISGWTIQTASAGGRGRSVRFASVPAGGALASRDLTTPLVTGILHLRLRVAVNAAIGDPISMQLNGSGNRPGLILVADGTIQPTYATTSPTVGSWALNTWVDCAFEINGPANQFRIRVDAGAWSSWLTYSGTLTNRTGLWLLASQGTTVEVDDIGPPGAVGYTLTATPGSYTTTGVAAGLRTARRLTTTPGLYALTGASAGLRATRRLGAAPGLYALTGASASLRAARTLATAPGSYGVTGAPAVLRIARRLTATPGAYGLTGSSANLRAARKLATTAGLYAVTGSAATLTVGAPTAFILTADPGTYTTTGASAVLRVARRLALTPGLYGVTGSAAGLRAARRVLATPGAYALTGSTAALLLSRRLGATPGSYLVTGSDANLTVTGVAVGYLLSATPGVYSSVGSPASLVTARRLTAVPGTYAVTGSAAALTRGRVILATPGLYTSTGSPAGLRATRRLLAVPGSYAVTGSLASLVRGRVLVAAPGLYAIAGSPALLRVGHPLTATPGLYLLIGSAATLTTSTEGLPPLFAYVRFSAETLRSAGWTVEILEAPRFTGETLRSTRFEHEVLEGSI